MHFQVLQYVSFIVPIDYCVRKLQALISYQNDSSLMSLGKLCYLEESYENVQKKKSNLEIFEGALYLTSGSMPLSAGFT